MHTAIYNTMHRHRVNVHKYLKRFFNARDAFLNDALFFWVIAMIAFVRIIFHVVIIKYA